MRLNLGLKHGLNKVSISTSDIERIVEEIGVDRREYQIDSIRKILENIGSHKSSILNMPQGLGKTFIAQVVSVILRRAINDNRVKVLILVPTRTLSAQHREMATWMRRYGELMELHYRAASDSYYLRNRFKHSDFVISNPILFYNHLKSFDEEDLAEVRLCVLDEIDTFSVSDWERQTIIRFHKTMSQIIQQLLDKGCMFLGLTASKLDHGTYNFWSEKIKASLVKPSLDDMYDHLPYNIVYPVGVIDDVTIKYDKELSDYLGAVHSELEKLCLSQGIDLNELSTRDLNMLINKILKLGPGATVGIRKWDLHISEGIFRLCSARRYCDSVRQKLFEDSLGLFDSPDSVSRRAADFFTQEFPNPPVQDIKHYVKVRFLMELLEMQKDKQGVIFCGFKPLIERLSSLAKGEGIDCGYVHGDLREGQITSRINEFRKGGIRTLFMTNVGKRGMDFPNADYMTVYSPRGQFREVDQQVCRIRSDRKGEKEIYLLVYSNTQDERKARTLLQQMAVAESLEGVSSYNIKHALPKDLRQTEFSRKWIGLGDREE